MIPMIIPEWPAPGRVRACVTTRVGGFSPAPFDSLNLASHVGDDEALVMRNRELLRQQLDLPSEPHWLEQVHGCTVAKLDRNTGSCTADAAVTTEPGQVCAVLTADCLPVLLCDREGSVVAAVHAGWRGLLDGVIEAAVGRMKVPGPEILAWMGPAIGPKAFEVGDEVRDAFIAKSEQAAEAFSPSSPGHWLADIYRLARQRMHALDVGFVGGGDCCTVTDSARFFSYRRDGRTGRMASLIWLQADR